MAGPRSKGGFWFRNSKGKRTLITKSMARSMGGASGSEAEIADQANKLREQMNAEAKAKRTADVASRTINEASGVSPKQPAQKAKKETFEQLSARNAKNMQEADALINILKKANESLKFSEKRARNSPEARNATPEQRKKAIDDYNKVTPIARKTKKNKVKTLPNQKDNVVQFKPREK